MGEAKTKADLETEVEFLQNERLKLTVQLARAEENNKATQERLEYLLRDRGGSIVASIANTITRWGGLVACFWFAYLMVDATAGKTTEASYTVLSNIEWAEIVSVLFGAGALVYANRERNLRQQTIEQYSRRVPLLEQRLDPNRTSSQLTVKGETNPEDL